VFVDDFMAFAEAVTKRYAADYFDPSGFIIAKYTVEMPINELKKMSG